MIYGKKKRVILCLMFSLFMFLMSGCAEKGQTAVEMDQKVVSADMVKEKSKPAKKIGKSKVEFSDDLVSEYILKMETLLIDFELQDVAKVEIDEKNMDEESGMVDVDATLRAGNEFWAIEGTYTISFQCMEDQWEVIDFLTTSLKLLTPTDEYPYYVYEQVDGLFGIYDLEKSEFVIEPIFEEIGMYDQGIALAKKDGYYGFIDPKGSTVIGFMFESASGFVGNRAMAEIDSKSGNGTGVIDREGNWIIAPEHAGVIINEDFIWCEVNIHTGADPWYGLYDHDGNVVISSSHEYEDFIMGENYIFATTNHKNYQVYDYSGNNLLRELEYVDSVSLTEQQVYLGNCSIPNAVADVFDYDYQVVLDENLNIISDRYSMITTFDPVGYAAAESANDPNEYGVSSGSENAEWVVLDQSGAVVDELPNTKVHGEYINYTYVNSFYGCGYCSIGNSHYEGVVNRQTGEVTEWAEITPVNGTECLIVQDSTSELYGLYDGEELVEPVMYSECYFDGIQIVLTAGAETKFYTPIVWNE